MSEACVWECANGHRQAVPEREMAVSIAEPRCRIKVPHEPQCRAVLVRRLWPLSSLAEGEQQ